MRTSGGSEHLAGQAELHAARTKGYARGTGSRVSGKAEEVVGVVTGDTSREMSGAFGIFRIVECLCVLMFLCVGRAKQSKGSARQRWN